MEQLKKDKLLLEEVKRQTQIDDLNFEKYWKNEYPLLPILARKKEWLRIFWGCRRSSYIDYQDTDVFIKEFLKDDSKLQVKQLINDPSFEIIIDFVRIELKKLWCEDD